MVLIISLNVPQIDSINSNSNSNRLIIDHKEHFFVCFNHRNAVRNQSIKTKIAKSLLIILLKYRLVVEVELIGLRQTNKRNERILIKSFDNTILQSRRRNLDLSHNFPFSIDRSSKKINSSSLYIPI